MRLPTKNKSKILFWSLAISFMAVSFIFIWSFGLAPREFYLISEQSAELPQDIATSSTREVRAEPVEAPLRIVIASIGVDSAVQNPTETKISALDEYLKRGVVRYPGSGLAGDGNMFIFGHSTGRSVVINQAYKAFNKLGSLSSGKIINIHTSSYIYAYEVKKIRLVDESEALVNFSSTKPMLTLSTCNSFGSRQERYVVEADLVGRTNLPVLIEG